MGAVRQIVFLDALLFEAVDSFLVSSGACAEFLVLLVLPGIIHTLHQLPNGWARKPALWSGGEMSRKPSDGKGDGGGRTSRESRRLVRSHITATLDPSRLHFE